MSQDDPSRSVEDLPPLPLHDPRETRLRPSSHNTDCALLAVDAGLRAGLSAWSRQGRLLWQRSVHLASRDALKRYKRGVLQELVRLEVLVLEGGGPVADIWVHAGQKRGLRVLQYAAQDWRAELLYPREQRSGSAAKETSLTLARRVLVWSGLGRPTSLRHDAAEAVLLGLYAVSKLGWLDVGVEEVLR